MKLKHFLLVLYMGLVMFYGCKQTPPEEQPKPSGTYSKGVFIANEGTFNFGNASLSFYFTDSQKVENDLFKRINNRPIGDVFQSMCLYGGKLYCVVNNMQKIEILNAQNLQSVGVIEGFNSPRYMQIVNAQKAYVTDMYGKGIWVVDLNSNKVTSKIDYRPGIDTAINAWTEQMAQFGNKVFVCAVKKKEIIVLDAEIDKITDTIAVQGEPQWMQKDVNGNIWVLTDGSLVNQNSALYCIDPQINNVIKKFEFSNRSKAVSELKIDRAGEWLYFIYGDVFKMNIADNSLPQNPVLNASGKNFYALGIDQNGDIFTSDAVDNVQPGYVFRYNAQGQLLQTFGVGVSPGEFLFVK